jgi:hypothetical protein
MRRIQENVTLEQQQQQQQQQQIPMANKIPTPASSQHRSPKQQQRANNTNGPRKMSKIPNGNNALPSAAASGRSPCSSPKRSPKLVRAASGATELKDYGLIDQRISANVNYPPHAFQSQGNGKSKLEYSSLQQQQQQQLQQQQQQQQQMLTKIPNPSGSRVPTSGLQKPSSQHYGQQQQMVFKTAKSLIPNADNNCGNREPQLIEDGQASPAMQARACSLPRQKRDDGGPTNVAVVSPMPNSASTSKIEIGSGGGLVIQKSTSVDESSNGDTLKNPVPLAMVPLGLCSKSSNPESSGKSPQHFFAAAQVPSATTMAALISAGRIILNSVFKLLEFN